jgi:transposase
MKGDRIELGRTEQRRLLVLNQLLTGGLVNAEAAGLLGLSVRQVQRLRGAYVAGGAAALVHGNRGRPSAHALDPALIARVVELARGKYVGFNQHHLTEKLGEEEDIQLSRPTIHRILKAAGIAAPRRRRPPRHRQRRDRYPREGMRLQVDASRHDWLEGRGPWLSLVGGIDDATGRVPWACFREREDAYGYFQLLRQVVHRHGIPLSLYSDHHSIFIQTEDRELTLEEQLAGRRRPTQFGRLLEELGVQLILARSPQAKGRVERLWGTFQDRLSSELRLGGACTREQADLVLWRYLPRHNRRFTVPAQDPAPAWIAWPAGRHLDDVFCFKYRRVVANDNTVRFGEALIDIPPNRRRPTYAHARVEVHERFDGSLRVYHEGHSIGTHSRPEPSAYRIQPHSRVLDELPTVTMSTPRRPPRAEPWRPARNHPWRTSRLRTK